MAATADKSKPYFPLAGCANDGWSKEDSATATCYCSAITASMFASNFSILDKHLAHIRGRDNLTAYSQSRTIASYKLMTNYFCSTCGMLMYRIGTPGASILRIGTVDDFNLHETKLKPRSERFFKDRVGWLSAVEGAKQFEAQRLSQSDTVVLP